MHYHVRHRAAVLMKCIVLGWANSLARSGPPNEGRVYKGEGGGVNTKENGLAGITC